MMYKWLLCLRRTCASGTGPSSPSFCARSTEWQHSYWSACRLTVRTWGRRCGPSGMTDGWTTTP